MPHSACYHGGVKKELLDRIRDGLFKPLFEQSECRL